MDRTVEDRLKRLEDERDILKKLYTYGHALDYGFEAEFLDCWTEDAILYWATPQPIRGCAAIAEAVRSHTHAPAAYHKHLLIEHLIRVQGNTARWLKACSRGWITMRKDRRSAALVDTATSWNADLTIDGGSRNAGQSESRESRISLKAGRDKGPVMAQLIQQSFFVSARLVPALDSN